MSGTAGPRRRRFAIAAAAAVSLLFAAALTIAGWDARARSERAYLARHAYSAARGIRLREPNRQADVPLEPADDVVEHWMRTSVDWAGRPVPAIYLEADGSRTVHDPVRLPDDLARRALRNDRAQVLRAGGREVITAPVKDREDWDIVAAFGVVRRPRPPVDAAAYALGLVFVPALVLAAAFTRMERRGDWWGRWQLAGAVLAVCVVGLIEWRWVRSDVRALAGDAAFFPLEPSVIAAAGTLARFPSAAGVALSHAAITAAAAIAVAATGWLLSARGLPARRRETLAAWGFLAPSLLHLVVFSVGPLLFALYVSMHDWDLLRAERPFVGLANYAELRRDPLFWNALRNTAAYSLYVPLTMALALGAALLVDRRGRGARWLRTVMFLPYVASYVAVAIVWQWMYDFDFGLLNAVLRAVGAPPVDWLGDPRTALPSVMVVSAWVNLGYQMVVYLAGLQSIPQELYEAARLDGATAWGRFRHVTLPLLRPVSVYLFVTGVIWSFHSFTLVYVMTEGGPLHATDVVVYQIYQNAWEFRRIGYASAMSWVLFALLFVLTLAQWRLLARRPVEHV